MTRYIKNIILLLNKQANKGIDKYGVTLEDNPRCQRNRGLSTCKKN